MAHVAYVAYRKVWRMRSEGRCGVCGVKVFVASVAWGEGGSMEAERCVENSQVTVHSLYTFVTTNRLVYYVYADIISTDVTLHTNVVLDYTYKHQFCGVLCNLHWYICNVIFTIQYMGAYSFTCALNLLPYKF